MAAVCAAALAATTLPLGDVPHNPAPYSPGPGVARADQASTANSTCDDSRPDLSLAPSSASGPAVERIRKAGKLVVGVDQNSYLWGYRDPSTGDIVGFDIDLVKAIAEDILGDKNAVVYRTVPTKKRFEAIRKREVDMVVRTVTITCRRIADEKVAFSAAYFEAGQQLLVPRQDKSITGFNDTLKGKRVCTASGSTGEDTLNADRHGAKVLLVPNQLDCLVRLQLGRADAVFTDNALAAGQAAQDPTVHLIGKPVTTEFYGVAMNQDDTDLVRRVNRVLEQYEAGDSSSAWMQAYGDRLAANLHGITRPPALRYKD